MTTRRWMDWSMAVEFARRRAAATGRRFRVWRCRTSLVWCVQEVEA